MGIHVGRTAEGYRLLFGDSIQRCAANGLGAAALDRQTGQMVGVVTAEDYVDLEVPTSEFHGGQDPVTQMMTQEVSFYRDRHGLGAETPRCKHLHIWTLAVWPEAAGRGVSKRLVTHVLARARELGLSGCH